MCTIYGLDKIKPDDMEAPDEYECDHILMLMTCTSHGDQRLLVRCARQKKRINMRFCA